MSSEAPLSIVRDYYQQEKEFLTQEDLTFVGSPFPWPAIVVLSNVFLLALWIARASELTYPTRILASILILSIGIATILIVLALWDQKLYQLSWVVGISITLISYFITFAIYLY